jgi:hypothetical protein
VAQCEKTIDDVRTDEPGAAGHEAARRKSGQGVSDGY